MRFDNLEAEFTRMGMNVERVAHELGFGCATLYNRLSGSTNWTLNDMLKVQRLVNEKTAQSLTLDYLFHVEQ